MSAQVSYTYLLGCLRYREKHVKDVCCCLQTCNSVVYVVVKGLYSTVEPPKRGQYGDKPFVLSREVVLFRRFLFLSLKMKHSSCLDTYTIIIKEIAIRPRIC